MLSQWHIRTTRKNEIIDLTRKVGEIVNEHGVRDGIVVVYCPHTTAGIAINENADPDVKKDVLMRMSDVFPWEHPDDRHLEGNTAAHLKAMAVGSSQTVIIDGGRLLLGRWQGLYFCEFDGPRNRQVFAKIIPG